jgi:phosphate/sulfate permease
MSLYGLGMLGALVAAASFLFLATFRKLPVSTTHAIVGGIVGITLSANRDVDAGLSGVLHGTQCVNWGLSGFGGMVASWVLSPLLAGALACLLYSITSFLIYEETSTTTNSAKKLDTPAAVKRTLRLLPLCYAGMTWTMVYLICSKSSATQVRTVSKYSILYSVNSP